MEYDLRGQWLLSGKFLTEPIPAAVPGDIADTLLKHHLIPDPFFGAQEEEIQFLAEEDFTYSTDFSYVLKWEDADEVILHFDSIDTIATVKVNGQVAAEPCNMFRSWDIPVKNLLTGGENHLEVQIHSPAAAGRAEAEKLPFPIPDSSMQRFRHLNLLRKIQCQAGWDWGVSVPTGGIYGKCHLFGVQTAYLTGVRNIQSFSGDCCIVRIIVDYVAVRSGEWELELSLQEETRRETIMVVPGEGSWETSWTVESPRRWYPAGYGEQPLYPLEVACESNKIVQEIGLRELTLCNDPDRVGKAMTFRVNGIDIFAKGANWIPADAFPARQTPELLWRRLYDALDANMNMIRIWGGGRYEDDAFYEFCDQHGILVWQDMMFACALYPATEEFCRNVEAEIRYQVRRLQYHPSVVIWCGDNEVQGALNWYPAAVEKPELYRENYQRLNRVIGKAVIAEDPSRVFWPSSPCAGPDDFSDNWHNDFCGDMHYWEVWHGGKDFSSYYNVRPRFCSEFGFQSYPSLETVAEFAPEEEWNVFSPLMDHHQKSPVGNGAIIGMFSKYFRMPDSFEHFLYVSQLQQALAIKTAVEYWRSTRPICMGTLYWQLNDNWPVVSWSSIEHNGNWKQLQYHAKRFYNPVLGMGFLNSAGELEFRVVCDMEECCEMKLSVAAVTWDGKVRDHREFTTNFHGAGAAISGMISPKEWPFAPQDGFWRIFAQAYDGEGMLLGEHENAAFAVPWKRYNLPQANISATLFSQLSDRSVAITLHTDAVALFVHLEAPGMCGHFSDSSFVMVPGEEKSVLFRSEREITADALKSVLQITHLRSCY